MKNMFKSWSTFEKIWLLIFTALGVILSLIWQSSLLSLISFVTGIICVILVAKGSIWNYPIGLIQGMSYGYLSFQSLLYGEAILNFAYFVPVQIIGWIFWNRHMNEKTHEVKKRELKQSEIIAWTVGTIVFVFLYNQFLTWIGSTMPLYNSATTSLSIIAMLLMVIRSRYQWFVWALVNIISIAMWIQTSEYLMAILFVAYLTNNIYGWKKWSVKHV